MKKLWAPWRLSYILGKKERGCVFCKRGRRSSKKDFVLFHGKTHFVILNRYPYNNGHLMVVPNRHVRHLDLLNEEELREAMKLMTRSIRILKKVYGAQGFNIGMNLGKAGGAGIEGHLHWHLVPRWVGDTNFMPLIAETRSLPEHLDITFKRLKKTWEDL